MGRFRHFEFPPVHLGQSIGGEWRAGGGEIAIRNPARPGEIVGTVPRGTAADAGEAIAAAKMAQSSWARLSFAARAEILGRGLERLAGYTDEMAVLYTRENGKPLFDAKREIAALPDRHLRDLETAPHFDAVERLPGGAGWSEVRPIPYGVVASIVPWNSPVSLCFLQIVPALLAGNTVVIKPPESCPLTLIRLLALFAGPLPEGTVNIVTGVPAEIGETLTGHRDVARIAFTGGVSSARTILGNAIPTLKGVVAELGGNDPAIVLEDADLGDATIDRMVDTAFRASGQVCMAIKRLYVARAIFEPFVEAFGRRAEEVLVGNGLSAGVRMGPLHAQAGLDRARAYREGVEAAGGTITDLGSVNAADWEENGYFFRPAIATGVAEDAPLVVEEQFCPLVPVLPFDTAEEALERANDTSFGLSGSVWTADLDKGAALARRLAAGTVFVNTHGTKSVNRALPYGGIKQSGTGRRNGIAGVAEYLQTQTLTASRPAE